MTLEEKALIFATAAHAGQTRKYTGEPYVNHCVAVASLVKGANDYSDNMIAAALLHDTLEDTQVDIGLIRHNFGEYVAYLVYMLTDTPRNDMMNRAQRKANDRERLRKSLPSVQTIKLADLIDNSKSIVERDPNFAVVYMQEKRQLLDVLTKGDAKLYAQAQAIITDYYKGDWRD